MSDADSLTFFKMPTCRNKCSTYIDVPSNLRNITSVVLDEDLMVWMRTAGLPNFRKLYARIPAGLTKDSYILDVITRTRRSLSSDICVSKPDRGGVAEFPVKSFSGTKSFVISTTSWLGGKNDFLGIAYIVVGSLCLVLGLVFLVRHVVKPRKLGDTKLLSWNNKSN